MGNACPLHDACLLGNLSADEAKKVIKDIAREGAREGAREVLTEIGLGDKHAGNDVKEIRGVLSGMRAARKAFWANLGRGISKLFWLVVILGILSLMGKTPEDLKNLVP